ncbi:deazapurine DNA modification protein DpdA family protein [Nocardia gipuzkoensis]
MRFYLGSHQPGWLARTSVPLFISDVRLSVYRTLPRAQGRWALDSGGFSMLSMHGSWAAGPTPKQYAERVRRYAEQIGGLDWAAPQDWMCEPFITAKTGLSVLEHQRRTVGNYLELRSLAPDLPFAPVLQGFELADYERCAQLYEQAGIDLLAADVVGVGSVCRRQATSEAAEIMSALTVLLPGVRLHGFGVKTDGLAQYGALLTSADSMAWSYTAYREGAPLPGCSGHKNCANCLRYALAWRDKVLAQLVGPARPIRPRRRATNTTQMHLFQPGAHRTGQATAPTPSNPD